MRLFTIPVLIFCESFPLFLNQKREKTSQAFRDALHEKYKSSNMKKKTRRSLLKREKRDAMTRNTNSYGTLLSSSSNSSLTCSPSSTTSTYVNSDMSTSSRLNNHQFQAKCTIEQESSYINHKNDDNTNKVGGSDEKRVFQNSSWNMMNDQDEGPICGITQSYERKYESNTYNNKMFYSDKRFSITTSFIPIDDYSERCDNQYSRLMNSTGSDYRTNKWANNNSATYSNNHPGQQSYSNNSIDTELDGLRKKFLLDECFVDEYRRKQSIEATNDNANELLFRNDPTQYQHERQPRRQSIVVSPAFDLI